MAFGQRVKKRVWDHSRLATDLELLCFAGSANILLKFLLSLSLKGRWNNRK